MTERSELWNEVRTHITTEARVLTHIQAGNTQDKVPEPSFDEMDSFTFIQLILSLESNYEVDLLEGLGDYSGTTFDDVADFVTEHVEQARASTGTS